MKYLVTLTGGIGSGKSTLSKIFFNLGIDIIDTDLICREILINEISILKKIFKKFGVNIINDNNSLNKKKLKKIIFNSFSSKQWLENLLHPVIYYQCLKKIKQSKSLWCLLVVPLLLESKINIFTNRILVIDIPEEIQLYRTLLRDNNKKNDIKKIISSQINRNKRISLADDIIDNSGSYQELFYKALILNNTYNILAKKNKKLFFYI